MSHQFLGYLHYNRGGVYFVSPPKHMRVKAVGI
jgi:hypothetical protein